MANIASLLKSEISRVARKEVRAETAGLKKALSSSRSEIAALKRRALALESELRRLSKATGKAVAAAAGDEVGRQQHEPEQDAHQVRVPVGSGGGGRRPVGGEPALCDRMCHVR